MGVDLRLLPLEADSPTFAFAHSILETGRDYVWHARLKTLDRLSTPIPSDFTCFCATLADGESGYGRKVADSYGAPLRCVTAGQITALKYRPSAESERLLPALAYIAALPPDMRIALDWH
jgi:hypothetical protein